MLEKKQLTCTLKCAEHLTYALFLCCFLPDPPSANITAYFQALPEHLALEVTCLILSLRLCFCHRHLVSPVRSFTSDGVIFLVFQLSFSNARAFPQRAIVAAREF